MPRLVFWTDARCTEAAAVDGDWYAVAAELSRRWGVAITSEAVRIAVGVWRRRAANGAPAPEPAPPEHAPEAEPDDVREVAAFLAADPALAPEAEPVAAEPFAEPPRAPWVRKTFDHYLVIPDAQIPFHHPKTRAFIEEVRRDYCVPKENMLCAGDEIDAYFASAYAKSPDAEHAPNAEIAAAREELAHWYRLWPFMRIAKSNHPDRILKRAAEAQIPSQLLRAYRDMLGAPEGWRWQDRWRIEASRKPFLLEHGHHGPQGFLGMRTRPLQNGISTVWGHQHANAGIAHVVTAGQRVFGMCVGSIIDAAAYAFEYSRNAIYQPWVGAAVILDGGTTPLLVPLEGKP